MDGEHVGLLGAARIDALRRLRRRQRGQPVAVDRGALEIERGRGLLHLAGQLVAHRLALAGEEGVGLAHQLGVSGEIDLLGAGRRAALDLMQQARPRAALEKAVRAGAQQERALQRRDGAVDRPHRGERPVIAALARARAAMLEDLRRPVVRGDDDVGKRLVVAQQHVEARPQPLDQVGFEQQRLGLGRGGDELHRRGRRDHPLDARVVPGRPRVGRDPLLDVLRLADVEHLAGRIEHAIDAGRRRRELGVTQQRGAAGRERRRASPSSSSSSSLSGSACSSSSSTSSLAGSMSLSRPAMPAPYRLRRDAAAAAALRRMVNNSERGASQIHRSLALSARHCYQFTNA